MKHPFTGEQLVTNWSDEAREASIEARRGKSQSPDSDVKERLRSSEKRVRELTKKNTAVDSGDYYEDPSTGKLRKTRDKDVGIGSMSRKQILRFAEDELGIDTDDMDSKDVNVDDADSLRDYVREYGHTYAGLRIR